MRLPSNLLAQLPPLTPTPAPEPAPAPAPADLPPVIEQTAEEAVRSFLDALNLGLTFSHTTWRGWGLLLLGIFGGVLIGKLASSVLRRVATGLERRGWIVRATLFKDLAGPANLAIMTAGLAMGLTMVAMSPSVKEFVGNVLALLYIVAIGWFAYNLIDLVDIALRAVVGRTRSTLDDQLVPLIRKTLRVFLVVLFALFVVENVFGADITSFLAGLGIAGLAVSLAAQDSIKNFFGSVTILLDRPFHIGELITFAGHTGTIEEIGFRSSKMRTLDGHLVTIPNSKIVDSEVQNVGRRPYIRRVIDVTVTYETTPEKMEQAVAIIKSILAEPDIASAWNLEKFPPRVMFDNFNAESLNIKVFYWFHPATDYWAYMEHAERFNLKLLRAFEAAGIEFAFPTQTLYLANDAKRQLAIRLVNDARESRQESPNGA